MQSELPPPAQPGELSVREKAVETMPGVYVTKMATRPVRLGKGLRSAAQTEALHRMQAVAEESEGEE